MNDVIERITKIAQRTAARAPRWALLAPCALVIALSAWWAARGGVVYGRGLGVGVTVANAAHPERAVVTGAVGTDIPGVSETAPGAEVELPEAGAIPGVGVSWWDELFPEPAKPEPAPAPPPKPEIELIAVVVREGVRGAYVYASRTNEYLTLFAGDAVPGAGAGAHVVEVLASAVVVEVAGVRHRLELNP